MSFFAEKTGNIWNSSAKIVCVTTNNVVKPDGTLVMGGGIAKQAADRYPGLAKFLGSHVRKNGNSPGVYPDTGDDRVIVSFPTKYHWKEPSTLSLVRRSAYSIDVLAHEYGWAQVDSAWPGIGLGGLSKEEVRPILDEIFNSNKYVLWSY